jgi:hypothetical protein
MKILLIKCDNCQSKSEGNKVPDSWHEFYYEFNGKEIEYTVCSFDCYIKQLGKILHWSIEHTNVKIGGMSRIFAQEFLKKMNVEVKIELSESKIELKEIRIKIPTYKKASPGYSDEQDEFLLNNSSCYKLYERWKKEYPDSEKAENTVYQRWLKLKNDKLLKYQEVVRN